MESWIGSVKRYVTNIQREVSALGDENFEAKPDEAKTEKKDNDKK